MPTVTFIVNGASRAVDAWGPELAVFDATCAAFRSAATS
jgi:hypothetical protein